MRLMPVIALGALLGSPLGGCAYLEAAKDKGAQIMDMELDNAIWVICKQSSVGAIQRRFGQSKDKAAAWRSLCKTDPSALIIGP